MHGTAVAALVLALPTVTAGAAVRGNGNGHGNAYGHDKDKGQDNSGKGNGNGSAPASSPEAPTPASGASQAPSTPPGQAKKEQPAGTTTAPGQAKRNRAATTTTSGSDTPAGSAGPSDAAAPTPVLAPAPPVLGKSMAVEPVSGTVKVRLPDSSGYVSLDDAGSIPTGSVVDARRGTLTLRSAIDARGRVQTATVRGAVFEVRQSRTGGGVTDLVLRGGPPASCRASGSRPVARAAAVSARKRKPGALWARDNHGRFRTRGRNSVATVRGTRWSTRETCAGTVTRVMQGAVDVRDLRLGRTVTVSVGHAYLARTQG